MIARASQLFLPTLRDAPADADAVSHKLLVRAGFIRQLSAGLWTYAPLGWRVHRKIEQIIREELDVIGAQEWFAPVLTPAELWEATDRIGIPELFRLEDKRHKVYAKRQRAIQVQMTPHVFDTERKQLSQTVVEVARAAGKTRARRSPRRLRRMPRQPLTPVP